MRAAAGNYKYRLRSVPQGEIEVVDSAPDEQVAGLVADQLSRTLREGGLVLQVRRPRGAWRSIGGRPDVPRLAEEWAIDLAHQIVKPDLGLPEYGLPLPIAVDDGVDRWLGTATLAGHVARQEDIWAAQALRIAEDREDVADTWDGSPSGDAMYWLTEQADGYRAFAKMLEAEATRCEALAELTGQCPDDPTEAALERGRARYKSQSMPRPPVHD